MPIGLFEAEKRGRTSEEDILTSKVFGILSKVNREKVLGVILNEFGAHISSEELIHANFDLWKDYNGTIPDVSIESNSYLIFIECKLNSPISIEQLKREYKEGAKTDKEFRLISLTKDYVQPTEIREFSRENPNVSWMNWQGINAKLRGLDLSQLDEISKELVTDLADLLGSQGMRGFAGFEPKIVKDVMQGTTARWTYLGEIPILIGELRGLLESENIELKTMSGNWFHRDGRATRLDSSDDWVMTHLTFAFGLKEWPFSRFWDDSYLYVRFYLDDDEDCKILIGYTIRTKGNTSNQDIIFNKKDKICKELGDNNKNLILIDPWWETNVSYYTGEDLQPELLNREDLDDVYRTELSDVISYEEMFQPNLISRISQSLIDFANLAIKLNITPTELSSETSEDPQEDIQEDETN